MAAGPGSAVGERVTQSELAEERHAGRRGRCWLPYGAAARALNRATLSLKAAIDAKMTRDPFILSSSVMMSLFSTCTN